MCLYNMEAKGDWHTHKPRREDDKKREICEDTGLENQSALAMRQGMSAATQSWKNQRIDSPIGDWKGSLVPLTPRFPCSAIFI